MKEKYSQDIISAGRRLAESNLVAGKDGSLSCRTGDGTIVVTSATARLGYLERADLVEVDDIAVSLMKGMEPSPEVKLHVTIYKSLPSVQVVVRVAPVYSTALGLMGFGGVSGDFQVFQRLREVARVPYYRPGTAGFAGAVAGALEESPVVLTEGFGVVAAGRSFPESLDEVESLEMSAKMLFVVNNLQAMPKR